MSEPIQITGSSLAGTVAIGTQAQATSHGGQSIQQQLQPAGFEALAAELAKHGVPRQDISALQAAIAADASAPELAQGKFGPSVREWLKAMFARAVDATGEVGIAVAGGVMAAAISRYYGWA